MHTHICTHTHTHTHTHTYTHYHTHMYMPVQPPTQDHLCNPLPIRTHTHSLSHKYTTHTHTHTHPALPPPKLFSASLLFHHKCRCLQTIFTSFFPMSKINSSHITKQTEENHDRRGRQSSESLLMYVPGQRAAPSTRRRPMTAAAHGQLPFFTAMVKIQFRIGRRGSGVCCGSRGSSQFLLKALDGQLQLSFVSGFHTAECLQTHVHCL